MGDRGFGRCWRIWGGRSDPHEAERMESEVSRREALLDVKLAAQRLRAVVDQLEKEREIRD